MHTTRIKTSSIEMIFMRDGRAEPIPNPSLTLGLVPLVVRILMHLYYPEFLYHSRLASAAKPTRGN